LKVIGIDVAHRIDDNDSGNENGVRLIVRMFEELLEPFANTPEQPSAVP
jgi:hypothetical protein